MDYDRATDISECLEDVVYHLKEVVRLLQRASDCELAGEIENILYLIYRAKAEKREYDIIITKTVEAEIRQLNRQYERGV